ncbi:MAG: DNA polymerase III subunit epsilon [Cenarchaeum sp. SB0665_bin_23]|nr:DNA polymerase III subunit epsilon [Cenarchaeum sp. SB0665_bin_23]MYB47166.1 DNA polymerase III subunit epsilon [Cenarchaeum sp. SB0662_bin_33]MYG33250.1 DNA polymerase III subunit epsilon [Cenarchaeum sp. SB0677_bin_16]
MDYNTLMWVTPSGIQKQPSNSYIKGISKRPENFRVLERLPLEQNDIPITFGEPQESDITLVVLDCETTGLGPDDGIIELSMVRCRYDQSGKLVTVDEELSMLQYPGRPIPPAVVEITGITDDMVRGKHIDKTRVSEILRDDPLVVAHNAKFDRPRFEQIFPSDYRWACTMDGISWPMLGYASAKLGVLLQSEGWFFNAHRAMADCLAVVWLLHVVPDSLQTLLMPSVEVVVEGAYEIKDTLKSRGYKYTPNGKYWSKRFDMSKADAELDYLKPLCVYKSRAYTREINPRTEFR